MADDRQLRALLVSAADQLLEVIARILDEPITGGIKTEVGPNHGALVEMSLCQGSDRADGHGRATCSVLEIDACQSEAFAPTCGANSEPRVRARRDRRPAVSVPGLEAWAGLLGFSPAPELVAELRERGVEVLRLGADPSPINLDAFPIRVDRLPPDVRTPEVLLRLVRDRADMLVDRRAGRLSFLSNDDSLRWRSDSPVGAVANVAGPVSYSLAFTESSPRRERLSTVSIGEDGTHPFAGHREWSVVALDGGGWLYTIRGANRLRRSASAAEVRALIQDDNRVWRSIQRGFAELVNAAGGVAWTERSLSSLHGWFDLLESGYMAGGYVEPNAPLAPSRGGRHFEPGALELGDVIVTANDRAPGAVGIYVGEGLLTEVIDGVLVARPLSRALAEATHAIAARREGLSLRQLIGIRDTVCDQVGERVGARVSVCAGSFRVYRRFVGAVAPIVRVELGRGRDDSFAVDQPFVDAFETVRAPLLTSITIAGDYVLETPLSYLGHLVG